jgi:hypothetical protein
MGGMMQAICWWKQAAAKLITSTLTVDMTETNDQI